MAENGNCPAKMRRIGDDDRPVTVVLGTQWGDEGKGKIVDMLGVDMDLCCRCQVSSQILVFSSIPSLMCLLPVNLVIRLAFNIAVTVLRIDVCTCN